VCGSSREMTPLARCLADTGLAELAGRRGRTTASCEIAANGQKRLDRLDARAALAVAGAPSMVGQNAQCLRRGMENGHREWAASPAGVAMLKRSVAGSR